MQIGDKVKIKSPFAASFPGEYDIIAVASAPNTYTVDVWNDGTGSDFYIDYLEPV